MKQPFGKQDDFISDNFRIPALLTMSNGNVLASADVRYTTDDSPNNLETGIRLLDMKTKTWGAAKIVNHFSDWEDGVASRNSASFIDPVLVEDYNQRVYLFVDAWPHGSGYPSSVTGSGMIEVEGEKVYALTCKEQNGDYEKIETATHYMKRNKFANLDATNVYDVYLLEGNQKTSYSLDAYFQVYESGKALTVWQKPKQVKEVAMSIFYEDAIFQLIKTSYLWMVYSDDFGLTWSYPSLIGNEFKLDKFRFLGVAPGKGLCMKEGKYQGRILIPVYDDGAGEGERASVLYSDDGENFYLGQRTELGERNHPEKSSESQLVIMPDHSIRMFARGNSEWVGYADSFDGGASFTPLQNDMGLKYGKDVMISVINYKKKLPNPARNNKMDDVLLASMPGGEGRTNGVIRIGFIQKKEEGYVVDWQFCYPINGGFFAYSCLTELEDGRISLLYEGNNTNEEVSYGVLTYCEYSIEEIMENATIEMK